jgi:hypothetical protein
LGAPKRAGQREVPENDLTLASPIAGVNRLKGKGAFGPSRNRVSYNVSLLNGDDKIVSLRGDAKKANRISISVPFGDASFGVKMRARAGKPSPANL